MELMTKELENNIPQLREQSEENDPVAYVKFFAPWSDWTWYAMEYDPESKQFFGLVDGFEKELGYFSLGELEKTQGPFGLTIERDLYFKPTNYSDL